MSYADGTLWVVNQDVGTVTGIDAATGDRRTFRFGHPLQSVAALHGKLLVEVNEGRTFEDRIDALEGKVARVIVPIYQFGFPDPAIGSNRVHLHGRAGDLRAAARLPGRAPTEGPESLPRRSRALCRRFRPPGAPTRSRCGRVFALPHLRTRRSTRGSSSSRSSARSRRGWVHGHPASASSATSRARRHSTAAMPHT